MTEEKDDKTYSDPAIQHKLYLQKVGQDAIKTIDNIDPAIMTPTERESVPYLRFSLTVSLVGESRNNFLPEDPFDKVAEMAFWTEAPDLSPQIY